MPKKDSDLFRVAGLWSNKAKSGVQYLGGKLAGEDLTKLIAFLGANEDSGVRVMVFKNKEKKNEKSPDYSITMSPITGGSGGRQEDDGKEDAPW